MKELLASVKMLSVDTFHTFFFNLSITLDYDTLYIAAGPMTINSPMAHLYYNTYSTYRFSPCFSLTNSVLFFRQWLNLQ